MKRLMDFLTFLGWGLIICAGLFYLFAAYLYVDAGPSYQHPTFAGFFHGRSPFWYLLMNGPLVVGIASLIISGRTRTSMG